MGGLQGHVVTLMEEVTAICVISIVICVTVWLVVKFAMWTIADIRLICQRIRHQDYDHMCEENTYLRDRLASTQEEIKELEEMIDGMQQNIPLRREAC